MLALSPYEWVPNKRFGELNFGSTVICCRQVGPGAVVAREGSSDDAEAKALDGKFLCEDSDCEIHTVRGIIHVIQTASICQLNGVNLIGSMVQSVLEMLEFPSVVWTYRNPGCAQRMLSTIKSHGIVLSAKSPIAPIDAVFLRGESAEHQRRERTLTVDRLFTTVSDIFPG